MFRENMFDAEAAVTLLNNSVYAALVGECEGCLDVLREGNLPFTYERGFVGTSGPTTSRHALPSHFISATVREHCA